MISLKRSAPVACRYFYCHRCGVKICEICGFFGCADRIGRWCSWRFSKLWISRGFVAVAVLVVEVWRFGGKFGWRGRDVWFGEILTIILGVAMCDFRVCGDQIWGEFEGKLRGRWWCEVMIYIMDGFAVNGMLVCSLGGTFEKWEARKTLILWANLQSVYENTPSKNPWKYRLN